MSKRIINILKTPLTLETLFLSSVGLVFSLLRLPSLVEPYWYGDEGVYQVLGIAMREGRVLYEGIWDNKPPLLYIIYAIFGGDLFYVRFLSLIFGAGSIIAFFLLASSLFKNKLSIYVSTIVYSLVFALPLVEGNIANSENFMLLPVIVSFYLVIKSSPRPKFIYTVVSGLLLSLAFLIKIVAIFDFAALIVTIFILRFYENSQINKRNIKLWVRNIITSLEQETILIFAFSIPILLTALYFFLVGAFPDFYKATFTQNVSYVGHGNYLFLPMGLLFLKLSGLIFSILLIVRYRRSIGLSGVVILVWLSFSVFNAFFSQRPYTHYLLVLLPSSSLLVGYLFENKKLARIAALLLIVLIIIIFQNFRLNFRKSILYYENYRAFITGDTSVEKYQSFFDKNTPRDYEIARFIKVKTEGNEGVFIWGDNPQIYVLSQKLPPGRYTVSYHVTFYRDAIEETKADLDRAQPKYIIQIKDSPEIYNFLDKYELRYRIENVKIYERQS